MESFHATTIVCVRREGRVVIGSDGQVTLGNTVMKGNARKVRRLGKSGDVVAGFAGATADAFTLFELFEQKLEKHNSNLTRYRPRGPHDEALCVADCAPAEVAAAAAPFLHALPR